MKRILFVVILICVTLPTFADDYASIQAEQYKKQLTIINEAYYEVNKE
jgi:hypothetical protein